MCCIEFPNCPVNVFLNTIQVISRVCQLMQVPSLEAGRIKPWNVPALKDLQYTMREINMFIEVSKHNLLITCMVGWYLSVFFLKKNLFQSAGTVTSICTLYELGQSLAGLKDKKHYEELNLGPLCKLPLIHRMFKIDSNTKDDDIHQIETVDILKVWLAWQMTEEFSLMSFTHRHILNYIWNIFCTFLTIELLI